jgi:hypothetical protein
MSADASFPIYDAERYTRATIAESPSLLANNLTAGPSTLAYVHDTQALMVPLERLLIGARTEKLPILTKGGNRTATQVKIVTLGATSFFVLCTSEGVHVFDELGYDRVHYHGFAEHDFPRDGDARGSTTRIDGGGVVGTSARGVCSSCSRDGRAQVCVGTSAGTVLVFEYDGERFRLTNAEWDDRNERVPVADVASEVDSRRGGFPPETNLSIERQCALVTANDAGTVRVWDVLSSEDFKLNFAFKRPSPVTAAAMRDGVVVVAESAGVVSFASTKSKSVFCEVQAHARFLSAMAIHPSEDVIATVAEDGTVAVWTVPNPETRENGGIAVKNRFASRWPDGALTGVAFCGHRAEALAVCAYDETEICAWQ